VADAVRIGRTLAGPYDLVVSSGAHRATQAAACFLAGLGAGTPGGVVTDEGFRSLDEDRWRAIYGETKRGDLEAFLLADYAFVEAEARRFRAALERVVTHTPDDGRTLVVGHSPMLEAAVWGVTQNAIPALGKGQGVVLEYTDGTFSLAE
jgi:broad specificity phosphatase PhoE